MHVTIVSSRIEYKKKRTVYDCKQPYFFIALLFFTAGESKIILLCGYSSRKGSKTREVPPRIEYCEDGQNGFCCPLENMFKYLPKDVIATLYCSIITKGKINDNFKDKFQYREIITIFFLKLLYYFNYS